MPVMTISLVCESRVTWKVGSSSAIFCRLPEIFCSSPRAFGSTARPNIGSGKSGGVSFGAPAWLLDRVADVQILDLGDRDDVAGNRLVDRPLFACPASATGRPVRDDLPVRALTSGCSPVRCPTEHGES